MSFDLNTSQLSELENYQPQSPMRKKQQILEKSKKGHERCVDRLQRKIICDKLANEEAKKQELQEKARKLKEWNNLMETVKSYQIPLIASISTNADDDTPFPLSPTKKFSANDSLLSTLERDDFQKARDDKKAELSKLANLEARERCTIRKRWYEGKTSFENFNKLLKFQNERRNAYNEGRFKVLTLDEEFDEYEERLAKSQKVESNESTLSERIVEKSIERSIIEEEKIQAPPKQPLTLEISSGTVGNVRGSITPKVSHKEELLSTQEIRKLVSLVCRNVIEYQEDLHRQRVRVYISKEMNQIVKRVIFAGNTRQAIQLFVHNICESVIKNQNEIERRKRNAKFIAQEGEQIFNRVIHYNETRQEIERVVSATLKNVIRTHIDKQNKEYVSTQVQSILEKVIHHQITKQTIEKTAAEICSNVIHLQETKLHIESVVSEAFRNVINYQNSLYIKNEVDQIVMRVIHTQETREYIEKQVEEILKNVIETQLQKQEEENRKLFIEKEVSKILQNVIQTQTINSFVLSVINNVIVEQVTKQEVERASKEIIDNVIYYQNSKLNQERIRSEISNEVDIIVSKVIHFQETKKSINNCVSQIIENVISIQNNKEEVEKFVCGIFENVTSYQTSLFISQEVNSIIQRVIEEQSRKSEMAASSKIEETTPVEETTITPVVESDDQSNFSEEVKSTEESEIQLEAEISEKQSLKEELNQSEETEVNSQIVKKLVEEVLGNVVCHQNSLFIKNEVEIIISRLIAANESQVEVEKLLSKEEVNVEQVISQEVAKIIENVISRNQ